MKIKKSYNILGVKYKVLVTQIAPNILGQCDSQRKIIYLDENIKDKVFMTKVLVHELTHALLHEYNLNQVVSFDNCELLCLMNEKLVDLLDIK